VAADPPEQPTLVPDLSLASMARHWMETCEEQEEDTSGVHERATPVTSLSASDVAALLLAPSDAPARASSVPPVTRPSKLPTARPRPDLLLELDDPACMMHEGARPGGDSRWSESPEIEIERLSATSASAIESSLLDMRYRHAMGDFSGALEVAEAILRGTPDNDEAARYAASCRETLTKMYSGKLGPLNQVPRVGVQTDQIRWLSLDHRAGFLLSLIDGRSSIEEILDICGMPRLDGLTILCSLLEQDVIRLGS
jgi:hypothetical protein